MSVLSSYDPFGASDPAEGLRWIVAQAANGYHVVPTNDVRTHRVSDCWCSPRLDESDLYDQHVHNSADGRESLECGERLPS